MTKKERKAGAVTGRVVAGFRVTDDDQKRPANHPPFQVRGSLPVRVARAGIKRLRRLLWRRLNTPAAHESAKRSATCGDVRGWLRRLHHDECRRGGI